VEGSCEHGNEPSGSIKYWDYFLGGCASGSFSGMAQLHEWLSDSDDQEIIRLLRSPKSYYRVHKSPSIDFILSQLNPVHIHIIYLKYVMIALLNNKLNILKKI
jgi:hypothetical protein